MRCCHHSLRPPRDLFTSALQSFSFYPLYFQHVPHSPSFPKRQLLHFHAFTHSTPPRGGYPRYLPTSASERKFLLPSSRSPLAPPGVPSALARGHCPFPLRELSRLAPLRETPSSSARHSSPITRHCPFLAYTYSLSSAVRNIHATSR